MVNCGSRSLARLEPALEVAVELPPDCPPPATEFSCGTAPGMSPGIRRSTPLYPNTIEYVLLFVVPSMNGRDDAGTSWIAVIHDTDSSTQTTQAIAECRIRRPTEACALAR